jgi:hypothetical protein
MSTTKAFRFALVAGLLFAASGADAKPRRVAILDFDGPRTLADSGRAAVVGVLADAYDVVASKNWLEAKASASRKSHGPASWSKASKATGVDAVIEGWVQEEGRRKVLTIVVTDASNGNELDQLTINLPSRGVTNDVSSQVRKGLEERFEWIEPVGGGNPDPLPTYKVKDKTKIGAKRPDDAADSDDSDKPRRKKPKATEDDGQGDDERTTKKTKKRREASQAASRGNDDDADDVTEKEPKRVAKVEIKETKDEREQNVLNNVFKPVSEEEVIVTGGKAAHAPRPTPRFQISAGGYFQSRTLYIGAEKPEGVTQYAGVPNKGLAVDATFYPFPTKKVDGIPSGIGFSFGISHSLGSQVTFDDGDVVGDYVLNQAAWNIGVHYRAPLSNTFAITGSVGYGQSKYVIEDAPMTFEVPDTGYSWLSAGAHIDMKITDRASVGFGANYLYTLGAGDLNSTDWYGPGGSSGWQFGGNFVIPLPSNLFIKGELSYTRIKTKFDGVGQITEQESVSEAIDSSISGGIKLGISF